MRLKNEKKVFEVPVLYPMGAFTFAIACSHCKNLRSDKCEDCKRERKSGFEPKPAEPVKHSYWESFNVTVCSGKKNRDLRVLARNCFRCNRCRHTAEASSNYYPHCGARMDGGKAGGI